MNKNRLVIIGLVVSLFAVSCAYAQEQRAGKSDGGRLKESIYKELNLTPEQQQKLEANRKAQREKITQLRTTMMEKKEQLQQALKDPKVVEAKVAPLVSELKSLQARLIDLRVSGILAVKEILSPEQFAKFNQFIEKRKEDGKGRFQQRQKNRKSPEHEQADK
jgi:Spy/CpxP family protein refolding chaperone